MSTQPTHPLPFVKDVRGPRGVSRRNHWAVKPTGDREKDTRLGRGLALQFMEHEHGQLRANPDYAGPIESIVRDAIGDKSAVPVAFFSTIVACSVTQWSPGAIAGFRKFYAEVDREVDDAMAALSRRRTRRPPEQSMHQ